MSTAPSNWTEANQRCLVAELAAVRAALEHHAAGEPGSFHSEDPPPLVSRELGQPSALDRLSQIFGLSRFERSILLLCAGMELDAAFAGACAAAQGDSRRDYPTFGLALAALPDAHWDALTPAGPLRRWRLIEVAADSDTLVNSRLRIDERILHDLAGVQYLDEGLHGLASCVEPSLALCQSHLEQATRLGQILERGRATGCAPVVWLEGTDSTSHRAVAARACESIGMRLHAVRGSDLPGSHHELDLFFRLWEREAALLESGLLVELGNRDPDSVARQVVDRMRGVLFVSAGAKDPVPQAPGRPVVRMEIDLPGTAEQRRLWEQALGSAASRLNGQLEPVLAHFRLAAEHIRTIGRQAREETAASPEALASSLWNACRQQVRPRLRELAQAMEPVATWSDLVLPEHPLNLLRDMARQVRQRLTVHETWGFGNRGNQGLGITALFAGASGTGKSMAAEVLARELKLDLFRIDLSQVISKYIGETEKNLKRVFDAAEQGGAVLLFDEADALFGKRSEVKDSHDRYANLEVSYLLQRMESYRGLAILTTNLKSSLDPAFLRRLSFVVAFPFPDATLRAEIWRKVFPQNTPTAGLDHSRLARLNITGGHIRNIAIQSAFFAADAGEAVQMTHLLRAVRAEYDKLEKPLTESEIKGWEGATA